MYTLRRNQCEGGILARAANAIRGRTLSVALNEKGEPVMLANRKVSPALNDLVLDLGSVRDAWQWLTDWENDIQCSWDAKAERAVAMGLYD